MRMRDGWEAEAANWAAFARSQDNVHEEINLPALLPAAGRQTLDLACGEGRLLRTSLGHRVAGIDAAPTMVRFAAIREAGEPRQDAARRWQRIPLFLHLRAIKP